VRELIPRLAQEGRAVFLCSHLLHEVEAVSDRVAILKKGSLVAQGSVDDLLGRGRYLRLRSEDHAALVRALGNIPWVSGSEQRDGCVRVAVPVTKAAELNQALASQGVYVSELAPWETELEKVFRELTGEETEP
jgi:ABC-2 type transport system ATP-binding protein